METALLNLAFYLDRPQSNRCCWEQAIFINPDMISLLSFAQRAASRGNMANIYLHFKNFFAAR